MKKKIINFTLKEIIFIFLLGCLAKLENVINSIVTQSATELELMRLRGEGYQPLTEFVINHNNSLNIITIMLSVIILFEIVFTAINFVKSMKGENN